MRLQNITSEPAKILVGQYTTKSGQVKNRYIKNPVPQVVIKTLKHKI